MARHGGDRGARWWLACLSATLIAGGAVGASIGSHRLRWGASLAPPARAPRGGRHGHWAEKPIARSEPEVISIPRLRLRARIIPLGLRPDGTAAVPLARPYLAGWFDRGPAPGQRGTAVLYGHADARRVGPAVFRRIGTLRPGNLIYVTMRDRQVAAFGVDSVARYPKSGFGSATVYGRARRPTLRLVTCGGIFDRRARRYLSNVVVFAKFLGARR